MLKVEEEERGGFVDYVDGGEEGEEEEGEEHSCEEAGAAGATAEGGGPSEEVGGVGHGRINGPLLGRGVLDREQAGFKGKSRAIGQWR